VKLLPVLFTLAAAVAAAESIDPQALALAAKDARLGPLKDLDGYFPWLPSPTAEEWKTRSDEVRLQMQVSLGLHPWPTKTPLNAVVHGKIEAEDYVVEKAYFEAMPGFFVTGSLYRPKNQTGPFPAVLCPHGHWPDGRFGFRGEAELKKEIASGAERFELGGRSIFQSLGVHLARMGCVAYVVDMIGYADSQQLSFDLAHKFAKQRPEMISSQPGKWGFYSPQAESHGQSIMGLQTWGNIRALDFLTSLPDVDPKRIGCTGGSGGGTQTMILGALDPRVTAAVPAVMVSTAMQGGCTCENACGLRINTGNIEFAALFAPKPMAMTSAKDWTIDMPTKGYPDLQKQWAMLGSPKNVELFHHPEFGHNYNIVTREHIYSWFNEHLGLMLPAERLKERDYQVLSKEQLTVWDKDHPTPPGGPDFEKKLLQWWFDDARAQIEKDVPTFRSIAQPALAAVLGKPRKNPEVQLAKRGVPFTTPGGRKVTASNVTLNLVNPKQQVTGKLLQSAEAASTRLAVVIGRLGRISSVDEHDIKPPVGGLLDTGTDILALNLLMQHLEPQRLSVGPDGPTRRVNNPREFAGYTFGYNDPLIIQRAQDVITALDSIRKLTPEAKHITLVALDPETAPIAALAAAATLQNDLHALIIDTGGFRFQEVSQIRSPQFLPLLPKYADLPGLLALNAPRKIFVMGESPGLPGIATAAYEVAGVPNTVRTKKEIDWDSAIAWVKEELQ
jgi:dienelactone hydrolase